MVQRAGIRRQTSSLLRMREKIARMAIRLPPLNAVRAFVAAARQLSFTLAAQELHVTHSAVSRQIRNLEDFLGVALFERQVRQVRLTPQGQRFFAEAAAALEQIGTAAQALLKSAPARTVRIDVRPSFAVRWLIPRLPAFVAAFPGVEPEVVTSTVRPGEATQHFDVAIRRGLSDWPAAVQVRPFLQDEAWLVAAPALLRAKPVPDIRSLAAHVLLSSRSRGKDWEHWKTQANAPRMKPAGWLRFDHLHFVVQAAVDGLGIALAPASLLTHDLRARRLRRVLPALHLPLERHYYGLAPDAVPEAGAFVQWLEGEMALQDRSRPMLLERSPP